MVKNVWISRNQTCYNFYCELINGKNKDDFWLRFTSIFIRNLMVSAVV